MQGTRITLNLDDDIHDYIKKTAAANGQTMGRVLSDLLRKGLNMPPKPSEGDRSQGEHLPTRDDMELKTTKRVL